MDIDPMILQAWAARALKAEAEAAALRAQLDAARWQPMTIPLPVTNIDVELLVKGRVNEQGLWLFRDISPVIGWRPLPAAPDAEQEEQS